MKKFCIILCLLLSFSGYAQDAHTFSKTFRLKDAALEMAGSEEGTIAKDKEKTFARTSPRRSDADKLNGIAVHYLSTTEAIEIDDEAKQIENGKVVITDTNITLKGGCEFTLRYFVSAQRDVPGEKPGATVAMPVDKVEAEEGYVKFVEDKIWVNPLLTSDFEDEGVFYYKLSNRQTLRFRFREWSASAFTLPLKFRFGGTKSFTGTTGTDSTKTFSEDFTTAINLNLFIGHTLFGRASYHYREKVDNITTTERIMFGALIGASTVTLDKNNTSAARRPLTGDTKIVKGLLTAGVGLTYSINKLNAGLFGGVDWSIGSSASLWNYNRRPWVGLAVGYSLFPFSQ
jgi:hypothetical protein